MSLIKMLRPYFIIISFFVRRPITQYYSDSMIQRFYMGETRIASNAAI